MWKHFQAASLFSYGFCGLLCCIGPGLHLMNDCGCQSRLISQPEVSERDGLFSLTPGPGLHTQE